MHKAVPISLILILFLAVKVKAQDTLPHISVKSISQKNIISWKNNYGARISTINIQRSPDSLKNFTTIGSVLDPLNRENGFVDTKAPATIVYYRVFIAFEGGRYLFSKSYLPRKDTSTSTANPAEEIPKVLPPSAVVVPSGYVPSKFIYTGKDNNIVVSLANAAASKYSVKFFDDKNNLVFEIHKLTEPYLIIEKVNFLHAGWFHFELFENAILKEKHKFYIPKEGKYGIPPGDQGWKN